MAVRKLRYNEDELLRKRCKEVTVIDDRIRQNLMICWKPSIIRRMEPPLRPIR